MYMTKCDKCGLLVEYKYGADSPVYFMHNTIPDADLCEQCAKDFDVFKSKLALERQARELAWLREPKQQIDACPRNDCQRDHDDCPDCYEFSKYKSPDIEED